jgi:hypothetical protein
MRACSAESFRNAGAASDVRSSSKAALARWGSAHSSRTLLGKPVRTTALYHKFSPTIYFFGKMSDDARMIALLDIGNTHTHLGLANSRRVLRHADVLTRNGAPARPNPPPPGS